MAGASGEGPETCAPYRLADGTVKGYARVNCAEEEFPSEATAAATTSLVVSVVLAAAAALFSRA